MPSTNINRLQEVAEGLDELNESVVYVGGAVAELYATDPVKTDIRPTKDIDCEPNWLLIENSAIWRKCYVKKGFKTIQLLALRYAVGYIKGKL